MSLVVFVGVVLPVVCAGVFLSRRRPAVASGPASALGRTTLFRQFASLRESGGGLVAAATLWLIGVLAIVGLMWPLGRLVYLLEDAVDRPAFHWFAGHRIDWWTQVNETVTLMGNTTQTRVVTVVGAVALFALRRQRRWLPLVLLPGAYVTEHYLQRLLAVTVDRGHPPTTLGTWPSGGVARAILIYGLIAYFAVVRFAASRPVRTAVWTGVAVVGTVEAYSRIYLLKHWLTDVVPGGLLFGVVLLTLMIGAARILDHGFLLPGRLRRADLVRQRPGGQ